MTRFITDAELPQGSQAWLDFRKDKVGASDAPIIMGASPWSTPYQLWRRTLGLEKPQEQNSAMTRGKKLEPYIRQDISKILDKSFEPVTAVSEQYPFMMASLDGYDGDKTALEIKSASAKDHEDAVNGKIPDKYIYQVMHQLIVLEGVDVIYVSYHDGDIQMIERSLIELEKEFTQDLITQVTAFRQCVIDLVAPALTDRDYVSMTSAEWHAQALEYQYLDKEIKNLEKMREYTKQTMIELARGVSARGFGVAIQKIARKGSIDYSRVPQLQGVNLEEYRKAPLEFYKMNIDG